MTGFLSSLKVSVSEFWGGLDVRIRSGVQLVLTLIGLGVQWAHEYWGGPIAILAGLALLGVLLISYRLMRSKWWWILMAVMVMWATIWNPTGLTLFRSYPHIDLTTLFFWASIIIHTKRTIVGEKKKK